MTLATEERAAICDAFEKVGPDRPTLCDGWTTRDLLDHLLARERQPWSSVGLFVPALSGVTDHAMAGYERMPWSEAVDLLRAGAPVWSPFSVPALDRLANGGEMFVHHEDVRRGEPGWEPRPADPVRDAELWALLARMGRMLFRGSAPGVALRRPSGEQHVITTGAGLVTIVGEPGELVLYGFGRDAARVEVEGGLDTVAEFRSAARGI